MVYSSYVKQRIIYFYQQGYRPLTISLILQEEHISASQVGIAKFLLKYKQTGSISRTPGSGRPTKITNAIMAIVEETMREDNETTALNINIKRLPDFQKDHSSLLHCTWVDLPRKCVLPTHS